MKGRQKWPWKYWELRGIPFPRYHSRFCSYRSFPSAISPTHIMPSPYFLGNFEDLLVRKIVPYTVVVSHHTFTRVQFTLPHRSTVSVPNHLLVLRKIACTVVQTSSRASFNPIEIMLWFYPRVLHFLMNNLLFVSWCTWWGNTGAS